MSFFLRDVCDAWYDGHEEGHGVWGGLVIVRHSVITCTVSQISATPSTVVSAAASAVGCMKHAYDLLRFRVDSHIPSTTRAFMVCPTL